MRRLGKKLAASLMSLSLIAGLFAGAGGHPVYAAESDANRYEMEDGELTGAAKALTEDGVGYVYMQGTGDSITLKVNAEEKGMYDLSISYRLPKAMGDVKVQYVLINGKTAGNVSFTASEDWRDLDIGTYLLNEGENTITIQAYWGWMHLDALSVRTSAIPNITGKTDLCDKQATDSAQGLMNYLADIYGTHTLTGQQENCDPNRETEIDYIAEKTGGKAPAIRAFDFLNYNPLFHYDDGTTDRMIEWANEKGGIVTASYHWFCPADMSKYELGERVEWADSAFYVNGAGGGTNTNFDVSKVSDTTSLEYQYVKLSLKDLATELLKLQEADVPVLFRPLHEAGGSGTSDYSGEWFWWSAKGPEAYKNLWKLVYTTLTEEYGLHNLIWEFNAYTYEDSYEWYPGDEYVDIIAYDKYNADNNGPNESALSSTYYNLVKMFQGKKMVTMAECDTIPSVENLENEDTHWLYVCPWYGDHILSSAKNNPDTLNEIYNSDLFITLDELPDYKTYKATVKPEEPTTEDVVTTEESESTTEAADKTTEIPGEIDTTTQASNVTTEEEEGTTAGAPNVTTEEVEGTTAGAPNVTTEEEEGTTAGAPNVTTEAADKTTEKADKTTQEPTHSHSYQSTVTKQATCTDNGVMTFTCACGDTYTEVINATGHSWKEKVTPASQSAAGSLANECSKCGKTEVIKTIPQIATIVLTETKYDYNGTVRMPNVIVMDQSGNLLTEGTDYTVYTGNNCKDVGQYKVIVSFQGNYTGSYITHFLIVPKATALRSIRRSSKSVKVTWKKQTKQVTGYQIQYSQSKSFKNAKKINITSCNRVSAIIKKQKKNAKYYIRIRTYQTVTINGLRKRIYSAWSKAVK